MEKENLSQLREAKQSRQFFSRLVRSGPSTTEAEARVAELEAKVKELEDEIERSRKSRAGQWDSAGASADPARLETQLKLEAIQKRVFELQSANQGRLQLAQEREVATKAIADVISSMRLDEPLRANRNRGP